MALLGTVSDNFDAGIGGWTVEAGAVTADTGGIRVSHTAAAHFPYAFKTGSWDLTGSYAFVEVRDYGNQTLTAHQVGMYLYNNADATDSLMFMASGNSLQGYRIVDNTYVAATGSPITLNTTTHRWLRIREASGTLFWDTSADGSTWTNRFSLAASIPWTDVYPLLNCTNVEAGTASYAVFDNFNAAPAAAAASTGFFTLLGGRGLVSAGTPTPPPTTTAMPFHHYQEYFGDGGGVATNQTTDLEIESAAFRSILSSGETTYWNAHHGICLYTCLPHNLINPAGDGFLLTNYPDSTDASYTTTMQGLAATYGIDNVFMFMGPEWDNDPGNQGWATNRFSEAGVGGSRPDIPTGLTRQQAYDQWIHFYTATNHGGNTNHHQLGQIFGSGYTSRGYKVACNNTYGGASHYSFEMGMDLVTLQHNIEQLAGIVGGIGMTRGAAKQYGKQWGIDLSHSKGPNNLTYSGSTLTQGWSTAVYRRTRFLSYMSGADVLAEEAIAWDGSATTINGRGYNPGAVELKYFANFAFTRHPYTHRGVHHVPVALIKDHISKWEPRGGPNGQSRNVWWGQISPNNGENMMHNLYDMMYPNYNTWGTAAVTPGPPEPMGSGRWGEQFDVLTERASAAVMGNYRVIVLATNATMDATLQAALTTFVNAGGILVINAKQLSGTAHQSLTGITVVGTASTSGTLTFELDSTTTTEPTFNYTTITLGTATRVARTGTSTPQITRNLVGSGEVWTVLPDYMSTPANTATLGVTAKLFDYFIDRFAVGSISGGNHSNIDWTVTKQGGASGAANTVTIINTNDVGGAAWTGTVSLPQGTPVREWTTDTTPSSSNSGGRTLVSASVPAGDVRVYAVG